MLGRVKKRTHFIIIIKLLLDEHVRYLIIFIFFLTSISCSSKVELEKDGTEQQVNSQDFINLRGAYKTRIIRLRELQAAPLVPLLRPYVAFRGTMAAIPQLQLLIVSDTPERLDSFESLVRFLDSAEFSAPPFPEDKIQVVSELLDRHNHQAVPDYFAVEPDYRSPLVERRILTNL